MAYIGKQPVVGNFVKLDTITTSATTTFNLLNGGVAYFPQSASNCIVSLNGIIQAPTDSYTISGSTIIFSSALTTSDVIDFIIVLGDVLNIGTPSDNTVSLAKLTATGTKDATTFLRGDNTFATVVSGLSEADQWRLTAQASGDQTPLSSNLERVDTDGFGKIGTGMTQSSGIFTFPRTGVYFISFSASFTKSGDVRNCNTSILTTTDNSTYNTASLAVDFIQQTESNFTAITGQTDFIFNVTNTTTHKCRFEVSFSATTLTQGSTDYNNTYMTFIRLGDSV
jgi:hypothetical protein